MREIYKCIFARIYQAHSMKSITSLKSAVERALFVKPIQEKFTENSKCSFEIAESFWKELYKVVKKLMLFLAFNSKVPDTTMPISSS